MEGIYITMTELDKLDGLPDQDFRFYVWLRCWMNLATGVVGGTSGATVTYRRAREWMEVRRERGSTAAPVVRTDDSLRASVARLVRAGLLRRVIKTGLAHFTFCYRLLLAKLRSNEEPRVDGGAEKETALSAGIRAVKGFTGKPNAGNKSRSRRHEPQPSGNCIDKRGAKGCPALDNSDPWHEKARVMLSRQLLQVEASCHNFPLAVVKLSDILRQRMVSEEELGLAVSMARRIRGVVSVVAYAVGTIRRGTLEKRLQRADARASRSVTRGGAPMRKPETPATCPVQTRVGMDAGRAAARAALRGLAPA